MKKGARLSPVSISARVERREPAFRAEGDRWKSSLRSGGSSIGSQGHPARTKWNERSLQPLNPQPGNAAMQRIKHPPIRNKISLQINPGFVPGPGDSTISADSLEKPSSQGR